jgi:ADP-ribose pyrophosphatase
MAPELVKSMTTMATSEQPQSPRPHGPWSIHSSRTVYADPWVSVRVDEVTRPDGKPGTHGFIRVRSGVSVLPIADDGTVYLTDEFHYAVGENTIEVVSGGIDEGEDPLAAAKRELEEELGIIARDWQALGSYHPFTSMLYSPTGLFIARGLRFVDSRPEGTEQIRCVKTTFDEAVRMVLAGEITHGPSCVLILKAKLLV